MLKSMTVLPLFLLIISTILSGFVYQAAAMTGLLMLIWFSLSIRSSVQTGVISHYTLSYVMVVYLIWLNVANSLSTIPIVSFLTMWTLAGLPITYLAWAITPNADALWLRLRTILWLGGVFLAAWALWQVTNHVGQGQAVGPLLDRNAFAALMNVFWFPAAYLFLTSKTSKNLWMPLLWGAGLFIISAALFVTASRGGIATWLLLLPVLLWAGWRYTKAKWWVACIPLIALLAYAISANLGVDTNIAHRSYALSQDPSTSARLLLWQSAIQMTLAQPFSGTGWGTFVNYYPAYRSPLESASHGGYAHNDYLQLAAEGGILALLLQLGVMLGLLFQLRRSLKCVADAASLESVALLLGALALFIHAMVNFIFYFAFMDILAGLYLARATQLVESAKLMKLPHFEKISRPIKNMLAGFVFLLLAAPLIIYLTRQLYAIAS